MRLPKTLLLAAALGVAPLASAADYFWDAAKTTANADGGSGEWKTTDIWTSAATSGANWTWRSSALAGPNDVAVLTGAAGVVTYGDPTFNYATKGIKVWTNGYSLDGRQYELNTATTPPTPVLNGLSNTLGIGSDGITGLTGNSFSILGNVTLNANQTWTVVNPADPQAAPSVFAINGAVGGIAAVTLTKAGNGIVELNGINTHQGNLVVNAGSVEVGSAGGWTDGTNRTYAGTINLVNENTSFTTASVGQTYAGVISGSGSVTNTGTATFTAINTFTGALTNTGTLTFDFAGTSSLAQLPSSLSGSGVLIKNGTGELRFHSAFYSGRIEINAGRLVFDERFTQDAAALSGPIVGGGTLVKDNAGQLTLTGGFVANRGTPQEQRFTGNLELNGEVRLTLNESFDMAGRLYGAGDLVKNGAGELIVAGGVNGYTGKITVNAGAFGVRVNTGTQTFAGILADGSGGVIGSGGFTKSGNGELILTGANGYTGATRVTGGTLTLDYSGTNAGKIADVSRLELSGGGVNLSGGSHAERVASTTLVAGTANFVSRTSGTATLNLGAITRGDGARLDVRGDGIAITSSGATDALFGSWMTVNQTSLATRDAAGVIKAVTYTDASNVAAIANNAVSDIRVVGSPVALVSPSGTTTNVRSITQGTTVDSVIQTDSRTLRLGTQGVILIGESNAGPQLGTLTFGTVAGAGGVLTAGGATLDTAGVLDFNVAQLFDGLGEKDAVRVNANVTDNGIGVVGLIKTGEGRVTLAGVNSYSGETKIYEGTLRFDSAANQTLAGKISGTGALEKTGTGNLTLSGDLNSFTGSIRLERGDILPTDPIGSLTIVANTNQTLTGAIDGSGTLIKAGSAATTLSLRGNGDFDGDLRIDAGIVEIVDGVGIRNEGRREYTSAIINNGAVNFAGTGIFRAQGDISGTGQLVKTGTGTLILEGENSFTGQVIINSGTVETHTLTALGGTAASGSTPAVGTDVYLATGSSLLVHRDLNVGSLSRGGNVILDAGATLTVLTSESNPATEFTGSVSGSGKLVIDGTGAWSVEYTNPLDSGIALEVKGGEYRSVSVVHGNAAMVLTGAPAATHTGGGNEFLGTQEAVQSFQDGDNSWVQSATASQGANSVILGAGARLSFVGTRGHLVAPNDDFRIETDDALRFNGVTNLQGDRNSELQTGNMDGYRISLNSSGTFVSTVGTISGQGRIYKTGAGELQILNESSFTGDVLLASGLTTLDSAQGTALASARSVNLGHDGNARTESGDTNLSGTGTDAASMVNFTYPITGGIASASNTVDFTNWAAAQLSINQDQSIRSLQVYNDPVKDGRYATREYLVTGAVSPTPRDIYYEGKGFGSQILLNSHTLTVTQETLGFYGGQIVGGSGSRFVKQGAADLVLVGGANFMETLEIRQGRVIANAGSLGVGTVEVLAGANLGIVQNGTSTLAARLKVGADASVSISTGYRYNQEGLIGDAKFNATSTRYFLDTLTGIIDMSMAQPDLLGTVDLADGVELRLGGASGANGLANAKSISISNNLGAGGRETTIDFRNTDQKLNNLVDNTLTVSGSTYTSLARIHFGSGSLTLDQSASDLVYAGKLTGQGSFIKAGSKVVDVKNAVTYSGSTVVTAGKLIGSIENTFNSSAALILATGAEFSANDKNQRFGSLYGTGGTVAMGAGTLTIGFNATEEARLRAESVGGIYTFLSTDTNASTAQVGSARTQSFLAARLGGVAADYAEMAFAGSITGTGGLIKNGSQTLHLSGVNSYSGATTVNGGVLKVGPGSLTSTSAITVNAATANATLEIAYSGATEATFTSAPVTLTGSTAGTATLSKSGTGDVRFGSTINYGVNSQLLVREGGLIVSASQTASAAVRVEAAGRIVFEQAAGTSASFTGNLSGAGTLVKAGEGTLTFSGTTTHVGTIEVKAGELVLPSLARPNTLNLSGASGILTSTLGVGTLNYSGVLQGPGTLNVLAAGTNPALEILNFGAAQTGFTGTLKASGITVNLSGAADVFPNAKVQLVGSTLAVDTATPQSVAGLSGDVNSTLSLAAGSSLTVTTATDATYAGLISGTGSFGKAGNGTLTLSSTRFTTFSGGVDIAAGTLDATPESLGTADVTVQNGAIFALRNDNITSAVTFINNVSGAGSLVKTGQGEVAVRNVTVTGAVEVRQGRLTTQPQGVTTDGVFSSVVVSQGATYQVDFTNDLTHDSGSANKVTGAGNLAVSGGHTLTLVGTQSYTGNTELLNGATLAFGDAAALTLNGLASLDDTTRVQVDAGSTLTLNQTVAGQFAGTFVGGGDLVVSGPGVFSLIGVASTQLGGLVGVKVDGGKLEFTVADNSPVPTVDVTATGNLLVKVEDGNNIGYTSTFSGAGGVTKTGAGTLRFNPAGGVLGNTGGLTVDAGVLGGTFSVSGGLTVRSGAILAPGNSPGTVTVATGDFNLLTGATLQIEVNSTTSDKVVVQAGVANLAGSLAVLQDNTLGSLKPARGQSFTIVSASGGITTTGLKDSVTAATVASQNGFVFLSATEKTKTGLDRVHLDVVGTNLVMTGVAGLADVQGFAGQAHQGLDGLVAVLDGSAPLATPFKTVNDQAKLLWGAGTAAKVASLSPLGYAAEYAMANDGTARHLGQLHDRLEQIRYDHGSSITHEDAEWEGFVAGGFTSAKNKAQSDTPVFDYTTQGGLVGLDNRISGDLAVGGAFGYDNGSAKLHDGGKIDMSRLSAIAFVGTKLSDLWYLDAGVNLGFSQFDASRTTFLGSAAGGNNGISYGAFVETGTVVVLNKALHLTPYAGVAYTHHEFDGVAESGSVAALSLDSWSNDSLRAKVGTGLGWYTGPWKLGVDVAYAVELADTESELDARFSGSSKFKTTAAALPGSSISITPSVTYHFDETSSVSAGYTYEMGDDSRSYNSLNLAYRKRF